jgi:DHA1 family tetracycline resistance protein-like MFS transporter
MPNNRSAALGFIFFTVLIDVIGLGIIIPVLPALIEQLIHDDASMASHYASLLLFAYAFMQFLFSPVLGSLSDKFGRRPILLFSLLGLGINYLFHAIAPTIAWLFVGRIFAGMAGASFTTAYAYISDISAPEKKSQNFGLVGAAFGLGFILGPMIGGLTSSWGIRAPFLIAAGLSGLNLLYGFIIPPESLVKEKRRPFDWKRANPVGSLTHLRKYPVVGGLIITFGLLYIASHAVQSNWPFFTAYRFHWNPLMIGLSLGFSGLLIIIVQGGLIRVVIPKWGQKFAVYFGLSFWGVGMLLFAFASQGWMMFAFMVPYSLGGVAGPTVRGLISNQVPGNEQGELQGALTSLMGVTSIIGPLLMNNLFYYFTSANTHIHFAGAPFVMGALLIMLGIVFSVKTLNNI